MTLFQIKALHTLAFFVLSSCVVVVLFSGVWNRITVWTWLSIGMILLEGLALASCGGKCPLTVMAERRGAIQPGVADIFLPKWFADRIFPLCGTAFLVGCALVAWHLASL